MTRVAVAAPATNRADSTRSHPVPARRSARGRVPPGSSATQRGKQELGACASVNTSTPPRARTRGGGNDERREQSAYAAARSPIATRRQIPRSQNTPDAGTCRDGDGADRRAITQRQVLTDVLEQRPVSRMPSRAAAANAPRVSRIARPSRPATGPNQRPDRARDGRSRRSSPVVRRSGENERGRQDDGVERSQQRRERDEPAGEELVVSTLAAREPAGEHGGRGDTHQRHPEVRHQLGPVEERRPRSRRTRSPRRRRRSRRSEPTAERGDQSGTRRRREEEAKGPREPPNCSTGRQERDAARPRGDERQRSAPGVHLREIDRLVPTRRPVEREHQQLGDQRIRVPRRGSATSRRDLGVPREAHPAPILHHGRVARGA